MKLIRKLIDIFLPFGQQVSRDKVPAFAAQAAFFIIISSVPLVGSSTVESLANAHKPQRCGVFLSNFIYFYVACVACLWYNGLEVMTLETIF